MRDLLATIKVVVNDHVFLKDPESSSLGARIVSGGVDLIDELGFECFTFRKLAQKIGSTEASIYRYFDSKHMLLLYLTSWYWAWLEYQLVFTMANITSPHDRLRRALMLLTEAPKSDDNYQHINTEKLGRIVIAESSKAYHTKDVDEENRMGIYRDYKSLVRRVSDIIHEINPEFKYPHMLVSTVIEGAHQQRFFAEHLPKLTDVIESEDAICEFYREMVFKTIENN